MLRRLRVGIVSDDGGRVVWAVGNSQPSVWHVNPSRQHPLPPWNSEHGAYPASHWVGVLPLQLAWSPGQHPNSPLPPSWQVVPCGQHPYDAPIEAQEFVPVGQLKSLL